MIEPACADQLGLSRNAFEAKAEPGDHAQASAVVGGSRAADAIHRHASERKIYARSGSLGHDAATGSVAPQPITEFTRTMQMHARVEPNDAEQLTRLSITNREAHGAPGIPIRHAGFCVAHAGFGSVVERNPR